MLRLLPLLALALVPAAVAAPVPPGGRATFGANGLLAIADLEKVHFDTRPAKPDKDFPESKPAPEEDAKEEAKENPAKVRPKNRYDLAVHMPWAKFREGEPAPAYFVLRNNRAQMLGLGSRMDLCGPTPHLRGGECRFDVRDRATGKSMVVLLCASTNCGGGDLVEVPADGFYCASGDLNQLAGRVLPPGEYEVDWRYGGLAAAPAAFTVLKAAGAKPEQLAKRGGLHFLRLMPGEDDAEFPATAGETLAWQNAELEGVGADEVAAALAVGPGGVYAPDVHAIPAADKLIEAWAEWRPYRDGDRVVVTLRAVPPYEKVAFADMPQLHLQVETPDAEDAKQCQLMEQAKKADERARDALVTPLTVEVRLPAGWREHAGATGATRIAVLVAAKPLELPRGGRGLQKVQDKLDRVEHKATGERPPVWGGVVRTDFTELRSPLPLVLSSPPP